MTYAAGGSNIRSFFIILMAPLCNFMSWRIGHQFSTISYDTDYNAFFKGKVSYHNSVWFREQWNPFEAMVNVVK